MALGTPAPEGGQKEAREMSLRKRDKQEARGRERADKRKAKEETGARGSREARDSMVAKG
jgi:hypothetical protein